MADYLTHSDTAPLPDIGSYTKTWEGVDDLLTKQAAGTLAADKLYTVTIVVNQDEMSDPNMINETVAQIEAHNDEVTAGNMAWSSLENIIATWQTDFNSEPNIYQTESETSKASQLLKSMGDSDTIRREDEGSLTTKASIHQSGFPRLRRPNNKLFIEPSF